MYERLFLSPLNSVRYTRGSPITVGDYVMEQRERDIAKLEAAGKHEQAQRIRDCPKPRTAR